MDPWCPAPAKSLVGGGESPSGASLDPPSAHNRINCIMGKAT